MSLRILIGLLVAAAVVMVPATNALLLRWWPPPDFAVHLRPCDTQRPEDGPCVRADVLARRTLRLPAPAADRRNGDPVADAGRQWHGAAPQAGGLIGPLPPPHTMVGSPPGGVEPFVRTVRFGGADAGPVRRHFLMINLISLIVVVGAAVVLMSLMLSRPFRALLDAIGDIERGAVPPAWAFSGPVEFQRVGRALERLGRQLRSNVQERELMLAGLSHDLRSPLARIQAALELRAADGEDWSETLNDVREIDHIVGQCIDFARDGQDEPVQQASLDGIVAAALGASAGPDLRLELAVPQPLPVRVCALRRALLNLVDNARVHGQPPIVVRTYVQGGTAVLAVEDGGEGISPEAWDRLRRPFARASSARSPRGCGLGLAIVQRVADMHDGSLQLHPRSAQQRFAIALHLPLASRSEAERSRQR